MSDNLRKIFKDLICNNVDLFQKSIDTSYIVKILEEVIEQIKPTCSGCQEQQPNQEAHMGYGGCLNDENEIYEKV